MTIKRISFGVRQVSTWRALTAHPAKAKHVAIKSAWRSPYKDRVATAHPVGGEKCGF